MRKIFVTVLAITLCVDVVLAQQGKGKEKTSVGMTFEVQSVSMQDYLKAKEGVYEYVLSVYNLMASVVGTSVLRSGYKVTYPGQIFNYGIQLNRDFTDNITLSLRTLLASVGANDKVDWKDSAGDYLTISYDWEFNIRDIGIGVGYTLHDLILKNSRDTFTFGVGNYSVEMKESGTGTYDLTPVGGSNGTISGTDSYSGNKIYFELGWLENLYRNKAKSISIDGTLGYKVVSFDKLGDFKDTSGKYVKFDFSGLKFALGLSVWF